MVLDMQVSSFKHKYINLVFLLFFRNTTVFSEAHGTEIWSLQLLLEK